MSKVLDRRRFLAMALASGIGTNWADVHAAREKLPQLDGGEVAGTPHAPSQPPSNDTS